MNDCWPLKWRGGENPGNEKKTAKIQAPFHSASWPVLCPVFKTALSQRHVRGNSRPIGWLGEVMWYVCVCVGGVDKDNVVFLCGEKEVFRVLKTLKHKLKQASKFLFLVNGESQGKDEEGLPVIWMQSTTQTQKPVWLLHARLSCMTSDACVRILI